MVGFFYIIIDGLLGLVEILIFAWVISSWLIQFNVINTRNPVVNQIVHVLWAATRPLMAPVQKVIPPLGGTLDISPLIVLLIIEAARRALLPWIFAHLAGPLG